LQGLCRETVESEATRCRDVTRTSPLGDAPPATVIDSTEDMSDFVPLPEDSTKIAIEKTEQGSRITLSGFVSGATLQRLATAFQSKEAREVFESEVKRHTEVWRNHTSPAERKTPFVVPQLCFRFDGALELAEKDTFLDAGGWRLLDYSPELGAADFRLTETGVQWEIDLSSAGKLTEKAVGKAEQYDLDLVDTGWTANQLCAWLERKVRQPDTAQPNLMEFVRRALAFLTEKRNLPLTALVRWKFILAKVLKQKIGQHREVAAQDRYQEALFGPEAAVETSFSFAFSFSPNGYAPHWNYVGYPYEFQKHFYANVGELKNKGEEYECAKALDLTEGVKHWVRNLERRDFWLPLSDRRFYPDFMAELNDGRTLAVEHKGEIYATNDDSKAKCNIGDLWEETSSGKALFLMTVIEKGGKTLIEQIAAKIGSV